MPLHSALLFRKQIRSKRVIPIVFLFDRNVLDFDLDIQDLDLAYFFATQDIARILRKVKDNFLAISRRCLVAMAPCQR